MKLVETTNAATRQSISEDRCDIEKILVAVDLTPHSEKTAAYGAEGRRIQNSRKNFSRRRLGGGGRCKERRNYLQRGQRIPPSSYVLAPISLLITVY
jgi:hypothetical protein